MMDFEERVRSGAYKNDLPFGPSKSPEREAYRLRERELGRSFMEDLRTWLVALGVPPQYATKVAEKAYDDGHSGGYEEVLCEALGLVDLFR